MLLDTLVTTKSTRDILRHPAVLVVVELVVVDRPEIATLTPQKTSVSKSQPWLKMIIICRKNLTCDHTKEHEN
jgi:hypothetical protein